MYNVLVAMASVIIVGFLMFSPIILVGLYRLPMGLRYSKWRVIQKGSEYWAEYKNIFGLWVSYWTWENTGYGVPYYDSVDEAKNFIERMKKETFAKVVYSDIED